MILEDFTFIRNFPSQTTFLSTTRRSLEDKCSKKWCAHPKKEFTLTIKFVDVMRLVTQGKRLLILSSFFLFILMNRKKILTHFRSISIQYTEWYSIAGSHIKKLYVSDYHIIFGISFMNKKKQNLTQWHFLFKLLTSILFIWFSRHILSTTRYLSFYEIQQIPLLRDYTRLGNYSTVSA